MSDAELSALLGSKTPLDTDATFVCDVTVEVGTV